jgi:O-antigen/teichoic acid export membrane protein
LAALKKLASQFAVYGISNIAGRFLNYLLVPLYTNIFSPEEYGINTQMYAYVAFFNVLLTYGLETTFFRFANKKDKPEQVYTTAFLSLIFTSVLFVFIATFFTPLIASALRISEHPEYIQYFIWIMALDAVTAIPFAYLRQESKALKFALVKNVNILTNILLNLYFLLLCPHLIASHGIQPLFYDAHIGIGYIFISNLVASAITLLFFVPEFNAIRKGKFDHLLWKEMMVYALPMMVVGFAGMINETLDRTLITWFYPEASVGRAMNGIYGANYKLSILMTLFIQAFRYAAEPFFFSHAKTTDKRDIYAQIMTYFIIVCVFLFLVVTLYIDVFKLFIGEPFREGLHIVPVLLLANLFLGIYYNLSIWYKLSDQTNKGAIISMLGAGITVVLNFWWIPMYGYTGAAWATLVCYASMMVICYFMGLKYYPIPYETGRGITYILLGLGLFFVSKWISQVLPETSVIRHYNQHVLIAFFAAVVWKFERKRKIVTSPD